MYRYNKNDNMGRYLPPLQGSIKTPVQKEKHGTGVKGQSKEISVMGLNVLAQSSSWIDFKKALNLLLK